MLRVLILVGTSQDRPYLTGLGGFVDLAVLILKQSADPTESLAGTGLNNIKNSKFYY